jgi:hypothetical protein
VIDSRRDAFAAVLRAIRDTTATRVVVDSSKRPGYGTLLEQTEYAALRYKEYRLDPRTEHAVFSGWSRPTTVERAAGCGMDEGGFGSRVQDLLDDLAVPGWARGWFVGRPPDRLDETVAY